MRRALVVLADHVVAVIWTMPASSSRRRWLRAQGRDLPVALRRAPVHLDRHRGGVGRPHGGRHLISFARSGGGEVDGEIADHCGV